MNALTIPKLSPQVPAIPAEFAEAKQVAIDSAKMVTEISGSYHHQRSVSARVEIKKLLRQIEDDRVEIKAPFLRVCREIDAFASQLETDLTEEFQRLGGLEKTYQQKLDAEAERKRQAELARIEREKRDAEAAVQRKLDEERRAQWAIGQAKLEACLAAAKSEDDKRRAAERAEADRLRIERENKDRAALEQRRIDEAAKAATRQALIQSPAPPKPEGGSVRRVWKFTVTDIASVYAVAPHLVSLEIKTAEVNRLIASGTRSIPGMEIYQDISTGVRT